MTLCSSIDTLAMAYLDDELADEELRDFELHLIDCAACRGRVEGERETLAELRRRLAPPPTPDLVRARVIAALDAEDAITGRAETRARWTQWLLPGAATVAAAAALLMFVTMREPAGEQHPRRQSAAAVVAGQQMQVMPVTKASDMERWPTASVGAPATGTLTIHRAAMWQEREGQLDMTKMIFDIGLPWGGHVGVMGFTFDSADLDMRVGDWVRIDGVDLYVARVDGKIMVSYEGPGDRGWVFYAPHLSAPDLLDLVAYHLLDEVGAR